MNPKRSLRHAVEPVQAAGGNLSNFAYFVMQRIVEDLPSPGVIQDHELVDGPQPSAWAFRRGQLNANVGERGPVGIKNALRGMTKRPHHLPRIAVTGALQEQADSRTQLPFSRYVTQGDIAVGKIAPVALVAPDRIAFIGERGQLLNFGYDISVRPARSLGNQVSDQLVRLFSQRAYGILELMEPGRLLGPVRTPRSTDRKAR